MTKTTRSRARPADSARRREILDAAAEVFAEKGVVAATVRDIGERAGILSGSLYHHFSSKEEMVAEILLPVLRSQVATFDAIATETGDPEQILRRLIGAAVAQTAADPYAARIIRNDTRHFGVMQGLDEVVRQQRTVTSRWTSAVRKGIDIGLFRSRSEEHTSELQSLMRTSYAA